MWSSKVLLLLVLTYGCLAAKQTNRKRHDNHKLVKVTPATKEHLSVLYNLEDGVKVTAWEGTFPPVVGYPMYFNVAPSIFSRVLTTFSEAGIGYSLESHNLQEQLDELWQSIDAKQDFDLDNYNDFDEIQDEMQRMADRCPDHLGVICDVVQFGETYEGRPLTYLRIRQSDNPETLKSDDTGKDGFWIDGNIHGGEWLTSATNLYMMDHLTRDYETDDEVKRLVDDYDWYLMPVLNADGYAYSHDSGENGWRKNRRPNDDVGSECFGTDLNRNYDYHWMEEGAEQDPCSTHYAGPAGGSEVETQAISELSVRLGDKLRGWISMHCAAFWWMHSWGWIDENGECRAEDHDDLFAVAGAMAEASIDAHGNPWIYGAMCEVAWPLTGSSIDYVKGVGGVKYSFLPELAAHRPPVGQIVRSFEEVWPAVVAMVNTIEEIDGPPPKP